MPSGVEKQLVPAQGPLGQARCSIRAAWFVFPSVHFSVSQLSAAVLAAGSIPVRYSQSTLSPVELQSLSREQELCV